MFSEYPFMSLCIALFILALLFEYLSPGFLSNFFGFLFGGA